MSDTNLAWVWYRAMNLKERLEFHGRMGAPETEPNPTERDRGQRRIGVWRAQVPFNSGDYFARRLTMDGIDESGLALLLGRSGVDGLPPISEPHWWRAFKTASQSRNRDTALDSALAKLMAEHALAGYLEAVKPLIEVGFSRVREALRGLKDQTRDLPIAVETLMPVLLGALPHRLLDQLGRTFTLELNVARLTGLLEGETPAERFQSFISRLRDPHVVMGYWHEYPVLARQLWLSIETWTETTIEFLDHFRQDWPEIRKTFFPAGEPGMLTAVESGSGDSHRGGRAVKILTFANGHRLVYKPRSLGIDQQFQTLLRWLNERGAEPGFRTLKLIDRRNHGWVEFIAVAECRDERELARFYLRLGGYLALFHALEATDFHFENLIACGEDPYPIDLEALFHAKPDLPKLDQIDYRIAADAIATSVLRVGLLPFRVGESEDFGGVDLSGMAAIEGQLTPDKVLQWENLATDEMRADRRRMTMPAATNRPTLGGREADPLSWVDTIVTGFESVCRLLQRQARALLDGGGPLAAFEKLSVRTVLRPTRDYHRLLFESFHPDFLRDALDRDRHFDLLWSAVEDQPHLEQVLGAERYDLENGDFPYFSCEPGSTSVWTSQTAVVSDFFKKSALDKVQRRLRDLGDGECERQIWFIQAALGTLALSRDDLDWPSYAVPDDKPAVTLDRLRPDLVAAATRVGDRLVSLALEGEGHVTWIGLAFSGGKWSLVPLMEDLYSGTPGIILFLAYLGEATSEARFTGLAKRAVSTLRERLKYTNTAIKSIGAFQGWGSLIYSFALLGDLWHDEALLEEARAMAAKIPALIEADMELDLIGGSAGCIGALLCLNRVAPDPKILEIAMACGDHLIASAKPMNPGVGWMSRVATEAPLTGLSHGAAGMSMILADLSAATGAARYGEAAVQAAHFEHAELVGAYAAAQARELTGDGAVQVERRRGEEQTLSVAWCYGAAGIGLARMRLLDITDAAWVREDLDLALQNTLERGFGKNHCLCHGDLGSIELFWQASQRLGSQFWEDEAARFAAIVLQSIRRDGLLCGTPLGVESPGLMNGLAGIGLGLLRLAHPATVPSLLTLDAAPR